MTEALDRLSIKSPRTLNCAEFEVGRSTSVPEPLAFTLVNMDNPGPHFEPLRSQKSPCINVQRKGTRRTFVINLCSTSICAPVMEGRTLGLKHSLPAPAASPVSTTPRNSTSTTKCTKIGKKMFHSLSINASHEKSHYSFHTEY